MISIKPFLILICYLSVLIHLNAQEGGPPMLTDDAYVADYKEWEINTTLLTSVTDHVELATPHLDINYGILPNLQLKLEAPLVLEFGDGKTKPELGDVIAGIKYKFLHENESFVSVATFPQYVIHGDKGFLLPVFVQKTYGKYLTGIGVGHFFSEKNLDRTELGFLGGFKPNEKLDLMLEYFYVKNHFHNHGSNGFINAGFRQELTEGFTLLASFGTQIITPNGIEREKFISFVGLRSLF